MQQEFQHTISSDAHFSECGKYRYALWRIFDVNKPLIAFIGLNPSTANGTKNDNTITKLVKITKNNGYGGFFMLNLFAIISSKPEILLTCADPLNGNDDFLKYYSQQATKIIFCWGAFKESKKRAEVVKKMFPLAYCLEILKDGSPKHPLYCRDKTEIKNYNPLSSLLKK